MTCWVKRNSRLSTEKIKIVITDIDGVLTDGKVLFVRGEMHRCFNIKDGPAFFLLKIAGIKTAVISGKKSRESRERFKNLGVDFYFENVNDKLYMIEKHIIKKGIMWNQICYIGDDLPDLLVMKKVGFSAAPQDAVQDVKKAASYLCKRKGGEGVFRETAEVILREKKIWSETLKKYLSLQF